MWVTLITTFISTYGFCGSYYFSTHTITKASQKVYNTLMTNFELNIYVTLILFFGLSLELLEIIHQMFLNQKQNIFHGFEKVLNKKN